MEAQTLRVFGVASACDIRNVPSVQTGRVRHSTSLGKRKLFGASRTASAMLTAALAICVTYMRERWIHLLWLIGQSQS